MTVTVVSNFLGSSGTLATSGGGGTGGGGGGANLALAGRRRTGTAGGGEIHSTPLALGSASPYLTSLSSSTSGAGGGSRQSRGRSVTGAMGGGSQDSLAASPALSALRGPRAGGSGSGAATPTAGTTPVLRATARPPSTPLPLEGVADIALLMPDLALEPAVVAVALPPLGARTEGREDGSADATAAGDPSADAASVQAGAHQADADVEAASSLVDIMRCALTRLLLQEMAAKAPSFGPPPAAAAAPAASPAGPRAGTPVPSPGASAGFADAGSTPASSSATLGSPVLGGRPPKQPAARSSGAAPHAGDTGVLFPRRRLSRTATDEALLVGTAAAGVMGATSEEGASGVAPESQPPPLLTTPILNAMVAGAATTHSAIGVVDTTPPALSLGGAAVGGGQLLTPAPRPAKPAPPPSTALSPDDQTGALARLLLEQCVSNLMVTTASAEEDEEAFKRRRVLESLHPFVGRCEYSGEVALDGAKALRVTFDPDRKSVV